MEEQKRMEAQKELEEIKRSRNLALDALDIQFNEETLKVILSKQRQYLKAPL